MTKNVEKRRIKYNKIKDIGIYMCICDFNFLVLVHGKVSSSNIAVREQ